MKRKVGVKLFSPKQDGLNQAKNHPSIFLIWRKEIIVVRLSRLYDEDEA